MIYRAQLITTAFLFLAFLFLGGFCFLVFTSFGGCCWLGCWLGGCWLLARRFGGCCSGLNNDMNNTVLKHTQPRIKARIVPYLSRRAWLNLHRHKVGDGRLGIVYPFGIIIQGITHGLATVKIFCVREALNFFASLFWHVVTLPRLAGVCKDITKFGIGIAPAILGCAIRSQFTCICRTSVMVHPLGRVERRNKRKRGPSAAVQQQAPAVRM